MNVLDLFSGIGGFSLGLERAGMRTIAFCEIEPYCRAVLRKHWPGIPIYNDVRDLTAKRLRSDGFIDIDVICGGFPCQDISAAGKRAGIEGERSGLWSEFARLIGEIRPRYAIVENVSALLGRGLSRVLGDLTEIGYDAEWHCIPASAVGAPHRRDRVWIVGYPAGTAREWNAGSVLRTKAQERGEGPFNGNLSERSEYAGESGSGGMVANPKINGREPRRQSDSTQEPGRGKPDRGGIGKNDMADTFGPRLQIGKLLTGIQSGTRCHNTGQNASVGFTDWWLIEPDVGRVANGIPSRVDRLKSLGNAVVPQIPEILGKAIMRLEQ